MQRAASPPRKKARISDEGTTIASQHGFNSQPPLSAEARRIRNAKITALFQADANDTTVRAQAVPITRASTSVLRDGLVNTTNLVHSPQRPTSTPPYVTLKPKSPTKATPGASKSLDNLSQASSGLGSQEDISMANLRQTPRASDDPFIIRAPDFTGPATSNHTRPKSPAPPQGDNREMTPPPSDITQLAAGKFITASKRKLEISDEALAASRAFAESIDAETGPGRDDTDFDISSLDALKTSLVTSSQGARHRQNLPFNPPLLSSQRAFSTQPITPKVLSRPPAAFTNSRHLATSNPPTPLRRPISTQIPLSTQMSSAPGSSTPLRRPMASQLPSSTQISSAIVRQSTPMGRTPQRHLGMTNGRGTPGSRATFITPFRSTVGGAGGSNATPSKTALPNKAPGPAFSSTPSLRRPLFSQTATSQTPKAKEVAVSKQEVLSPNACFDIRKRGHRLSLRQSDISPGIYSARDLANYGVPEEVPMITPTNAPDYAFYQSDDDGGYINLGCAEAFTHLRGRGCTLMSEEWVSNRWSLVLWKKASMVCCKPELLNTTWKFENVCENLMYHYERELNRGQRPIVKMILEQDAPPNRPMTLAVSNMTWTPQKLNEDGTEIILPHPTFELTDGWYKIRAEVDETLARAARRRKIRLGTKIVISGASLKKESDDAREALQAYKSCSLKISGNSTTLAKWDARLGPLLHSVPSRPPSPAAKRIIVPPVMSLSSLTPEGGIVSLVDIVIEKMYPVGYDETLPDGTRVGTVNAAGNSAADAKVEAERMAILEKEKRKLDKKIDVLLDVMSKAYGMAGGWAPGVDDEEPLHVDNLLDDIVDAESRAAEVYRTMMPRLTPKDHAWIARGMEKRVDEMRESATKDIMDEVDDQRPQRRVSNFRIIIVRDARASSSSSAQRRPPTNLTAQLRMWNVISLGDGFLTEGKRYLVSSLLPTCESSWGEVSAAAAGDSDKIEKEIHLKSTSGTRWQGVGYGRGRE